MEQNKIQEILEKNNLDTTDRVVASLCSYTDSIYRANEKFNLTGIKEKEKILNELVMSSVVNLSEIIVPRGTCFADIGSGGGMPGLVLCIIYDDIQGVLVDSNSKKIDFLKKTVSVLNLKNVSIVKGRAEELSRAKDFREKFDFVASRAFAQFYSAVEMCLPFVKNNGLFLYYSNRKKNDLTDNEINHAAEVGGVVSGVFSSGLVLKKMSLTPDVYPRRFAVINREQKIISKS